MSKQSNDTLKLKRSFGMRESVTITAGQVIGVGLFVTGANVVGLMGNQIILATAAALLITIYPALLYAEMGSALPYSGGTYLYALLGLSGPWAFWRAGTTSSPSSAWPAVRPSPLPSTSRPYSPPSGWSCR